MKKWIVEDRYLRSYRKRIIWFAWISGIYIVSYLAFFIVSLFVEMEWNFTEPLIAYCLYSIWFNAYNYYRFRENSLESEKHTNELYADLCKTLEVEFEPFNSKRSRQHVFAFSLLAIIMNVLLIVFNGGNYWS